MMYEMLVG